MFKDKLQFSREKLEFYYSLFVLAVIPILIIANTLLIITAVRGSFDTELRKKADIANSILATSVASRIDDTNYLEKVIQNIAIDQTDIKDIFIAVPATKAGSFKVVAAQSTDLINKELSDVLLSTVVTRGRSTAQIVTSTSGSERFWNVVSPLNINNATVALVSVSVSLKSADTAMSAIMLRSLFILVVTIVVIVLLLLNHFRFVEYAMLFRKLKEVDELKNDFLSVATHELKAPMTIIRGNIENLIEGLNGTVDEMGKQTLTDMMHETERLNGLVNDLLNVSRLEQGRISYDMKTVDERAIIEKIVTQYQPKAMSKQLTLVYEKPEVVCAVSVDEGRFTEIMTNLIDNAVKYSRQGKIIVSQKVTDKTISVSVRDTGIGMSAQDREKLFNRFYRVKNENTKDIAGTGLGLWIIKQYIEHMAGSISVDSLENVGTEFVVEFPRIKNDSASQ
jgi:signal transduction histidine kinase